MPVRCYGKYIYHISDVNVLDNFVFLSRQESMLIRLVDVVDVKLVALLPPKDLSAYASLARNLFC
jgi:hypothetical protein